MEKGPKSRQAPSAAGASLLFAFAYMSPSALAAVDDAVNGGGDAQTMSEYLGGTKVASAAVPVVVALLALLFFLSQWTWHVLGSLRTKERPARAGRPRLACFLALLCLTVNCTIGVILFTVLYLNGAWVLVRRSSEASSLWTLAERTVAGASGLLCFVASGSLFWAMSRLLRTARRAIRENRHDLMDVSSFRAKPKAGTAANEDLCLPMNFGRLSVLYYLLGVCTLLTAIVGFGEPAWLLVAACQVGVVLFGTFALGAYQAWLNDYIPCVAAVESEQQKGPAIISQPSSGETPPHAPKAEILTVTPADALSRTPP